MWFDMAKNKKRFKILIYFETGETSVIATTEHRGYAQMIARTMDDYYKLKDMEVLIEIR